ncbi:hypothetical protein F4811DRAFT_224956 [Daldinia bambusicola]|nr:hypothetical protein F4811DRAFT_224956 [Daldinia bambusicola]
MRSMRSMRSRRFLGLQQCLQVCKINPPICPDRPDRPDSPGLWYCYYCMYCDVLQRAGTVPGVIISCQQVSTCKFRTRLSNQTNQERIREENCPIPSNNVPRNPPKKPSPLSTSELEPRYLRLGSKLADYWLNWDGLGRTWMDLAGLGRWDWVDVPLSVPLLPKLPFHFFSIGPKTRARQLNAIPAPASLEFALGTFSNSHC